VDWTEPGMGAELEAIKPPITCPDRGEFPSQPGSERRIHLLELWLFLHFGSRHRG
jgi:hypothetical protein